MAKKKPKTELTRAQKTADAAPSKRLVGDLRQLIEQSRQEVAKTVNSAIVWLYWHIGKRIREDILGNQRAGYGEQIVSSLSAQLTAEHGRGFSRRNLFRMIRFAEVFPDEEIVSSLMTQLSWTHLPQVLPKDELQRKLRDAVRLARERLAHEGIAKAAKEPRAKARRGKGKK